MNAAEGAGRTVEEAIGRALKEMELQRSEVDVEILQEPRPALLGLGGREAKVRVTRRRTSADESRDFTATVLGMMGYATVVNSLENDEGVAVTLEGGDLGGLIGRRGHTLDSLEFLVALHLIRRFGRRVPVALDAAGYRARREKALLEMARQAADRVVSERKPVSLEPMEPRDRRTIHMALADDPRVTTASEGEDEARHIVVVPRSDGAPGRVPADESQNDASEGPSLGV